MCGIELKGIGHTVRVVLYLALFLVSSVSAGEGKAENIFGSLDSNFTQLDQGYNLQPSDVEDLDEGANIASFLSPTWGFSHCHLYPPVHGYEFGHPSYSSIRAPPVLLS